MEEESYEQPDLPNSPDVKAYIKKSGPDLLEKWKDKPEMLGPLRTAHWLICQMRENAINHQRLHARTALEYPDLTSPDMAGKSTAELEAIAYGKAAEETS